jgi:hypothetical protein
LSIPAAVAITRLTVISTLCVSWGFGGSVQAQRPAKPDAVLENLHQIGKVVAQAVLDRDVRVLLRYDRADLLAEDESSLKDAKSDLYCYLFDSSCISGKGRSVLDKLATSRQIAIKVIDGGKSKSNGIRYASLLFYDKATVSERSLQSRKFLCEHSLDEIASWTFKLVNGKWLPVTPLFDNETDTLCSPD